MSHLLIGLTNDDTSMSVTLVEAAPGSQQALHAHPDSVQVYLVIAGRGRMIVGTEEANVSYGDSVYIPADTTHAIRNVSDETLTYVSATSPAFPVRVDGMTWQPAG